MSRSRKSRTYTCILLSNAHRSPIQFKLNLYAILSIPLLMLALTLACLHFYQQYTGYSMQTTHLAEALSGKEKAFANMVEIKDQTIEELQTEIVSLSIQAEDVKHKVNQLKQLENDLIELTQPDAAEAQARSHDHEVAIASVSPAVGGQSFSINNISQLASETSREYAQLNHSIHDLDSRLVKAKEQVIAHQELMKITPSIWPTVSTRVTSTYGYRSDPFTNRRSFHSGIDIGGSYNDPVYATADGKVTASYYNYAKGNYVVIDHSGGISTRYFHLNKRLVEIGDTVNKGDKIGLLGSTGRSTGAHLHYEVVADEKIVDPKPYMPNP